MVLLVLFFLSQLQDVMEILVGERDRLQFQVMILLRNQILPRVIAWIKWGPHLIYISWSKKLVSLSFASGPSLVQSLFWAFVALNVKTQVEFAVER